MNINEESAAVLRHVTRARQITTTEAVRRAIALLGFFEEAKERQVDILTRDNSGNVEKLLYQL